MSKFLKNAKRVFLVAKKPDKPEFFGIAKATGIGILFVGLVGFLAYIIFHFFLIG